MMRVVLMFLLCPCGLPGHAHPFHVTLAQANHNPDGETLEINMKILSDDFEKGMTAHFGNWVLSNSEKDITTAGSLIREYGGSKFQLRSGDMEHQQEWIGKEVEWDKMWCYWKVPGIQALEELIVWCPLLTNVYDNQTNIIHPFSDNAKGSVLLHKDEPIKFIILN